MCGGAIAIALFSALLSLVALYKCSCEKLPRVSLAKKVEKRRRRYILTQVISEGKVDQKCLQEAVEKAIEQLYGRLGLAKVNPKVVYVDLKTMSVIIRCEYEGKPILLASLIELKEACGKRVRLVPLRAFGTLKSARDKIPKVA